MTDFRNGYQMHYYAGYGFMNMAPIYIEKLNCDIPSLYRDLFVKSYLITYHH